jgi:hypothetical protein
MKSANFEVVFCGFVYSSVTFSVLGLMYLSASCPSISSIYILLLGGGTRSETHVKHTTEIAVRSGGLENRDSYSGQMFSDPVRIPAAAKSNCFSCSE